MKNYAMEYRMEYEAKYRMEYDMERMISMHRFMKQKKLITFKPVEMIKQLIHKGVNLNIVNKVNNIINYFIVVSLYREVILYFMYCLIHFNSTS